MISSRWSGRSSERGPGAATARRPRPPLLELIGPAAAGKSTLARQLRARAGDIRGPLAVWGLPRVRLATHGVRLLPTFLRMARDPRPPAWGELAHFIRLQTLHEVVERERATSPAGILLDEGPVFALSWMDVFHADRHGPRFADWRRRALVRWARALDLVVMMDAPDAVLVRRLRTRAKQHDMKDAPEQEVRAFTARFRAAFDRVLGDLRAYGGPPVLTLMTGDEPCEHTAQRVLTAISEAVNGD